jgi:RimJ/RimL family protein N-acetyltransferase
MILYPKLISFEKLQTNDLPLMHRWLNEPHVHEWYDKDKKNTIEDITERYSPKINKDKLSDAYLVLYDKKKVAYIQTYKVNDWPEFGEYMGYDDHTASVDLFIGEKSFLGKGFGSFFLKKFLNDVVFANDTISTCIIGPEPNNKRAIKAYEKVGFTYKKTVQIPNEPDPTYIMELRK